MQAKYLTSVSVALTLVMTATAALAQSPETIQPQPAQPQPAQPQPVQPQPGQPQSPPSQQQAPQTQVSQDELQKFASAIKKLQPIQQQAQTQVTQIIQQADLSEKRFSEIYQARQNPQAQPKPAITPEETKKFDQANVKIQQIEKATQSKMEETVQSEGLDVKRFSQIFVAVRQNPELLQKVRQMIQS